MVGFRWPKTFSGFKTCESAEAMARILAALALSITMRELLDLYGDYDSLTSAISLLSWDRQVLMPVGGIEARNLHIESLTRMAHRLLVSQDLQDRLQLAEGAVEPDSAEAAMCARLRREIDVATKLPEALVTRKAATSSAAYEVWKHAKANNDFAALRPYLEQLFEIAKETSEHLGYTDHPYDPLIDLFEEGSSHDEASGLFEVLRSEIVPLVGEIKEKGDRFDDAPLYGDWPPETLRRFSEDAASTIGFAFDKGRLNLAPNAFCTSLAETDVRMTTRASNHVKGVISSTLHEMGHGLYEQGSPSNWFGTPLAGGISSAVHESQSRLWENIVGRSRGFWCFFLPRLQRCLPELSSVSIEQFHRGMNVVKPEPIRVGADELTYNLHIIARFELEVEIVTGKLAIRDLPEAWNEKYRAYLGIVPESDSVGCLQDVHWTRGSVGYFPTYAIGNLIGAQIWERMQAEVGDTEGLMARGEFAPILDWLRQRVYSLASRYEPKELVRRVTGGETRPDAWIRYARAKYRGLYGLD
jgi:carboxypeptidase Taq